MKNLNISWIIGLLASGLFLSGCASLKSVSMTQVPSDRNHPIEETVSNWGFLGIHFSNSFADEAVEKLQQKCPSGKITGVYTKYENYFYVFLDKRVVNAKAFCEKLPAQKVSYETTK